MKKAETREMLSKGGTTDPDGGLPQERRRRTDSLSIIQCTSCKKEKLIFEYLRACTLWLTRRLERLRVSASRRARGTRNSSKRFLRHKVDVGER